MAIVQISRITNRKGLQVNLPQLAGAEFGWCIDSRRLFIGNGTLADGAPIVGNTEILTEFSDITSLSSYTYADIAVGYAAQTGPTDSDPTVRTVQAKLDDFASVRDFGAVGDGVADDTQAIQRALNQLYCRETNTQIRRSLYFPAGTYRVTETINIPTYAKLVGEGADCSIIWLDTSSDISSLSAYVARYADSKGQTGANIGNNGAIAPTHIEISSMSFVSNEVTDVFLIEAASYCWFSNVTFQGPLTVTDIIDTGFNPATTNVAGVRFSSTPSRVCTQITFESCGFNNNTFGVATDQDLAGIVFANSSFDTLYQGIVLTNNPTGVRIANNLFDNIFAQGIVFDQTNLNVSTNNIFYNVGNNIGSTSPVTALISMSNNNLSVGDLAQRTDPENIEVPRIEIVEGLSNSGGAINSFGKYSISNGAYGTIDDNQAAPSTLFTVSSIDIHGFRMQYTVRRSGFNRHGVLTVVPGVSYDDDYTESGDVGTTLVPATGTIPNTVDVNYTSTSTGGAGEITYNITYLS